MYLTENLPGNSRKLDARPADIRQKLEGYQKDFKSYLNAPPLVRPIAIEKYNVEKPPELTAEYPPGSRRTVDSENINKRDVNGGKAQNNTSVNVASYVNSLLDALPKAHRSRGRQLLPHLFRLNILNLSSTPSAEEISTAKNLLYDLVAKNAKRIRSIHSPQLLASAVRELSGDPLVDKRLFTAKLVLHQGEEAGSEQHRSARSHPRRSRVLASPAYGKHFYQGRATWA